MEKRKLELLKTEKFEYKDYVTHLKVDEIIEVVRGIYFLGLQDMPKPIKIKGLEGVYFKSERLGLLFEYRMRINEDNTFTLEEMTIESVNKFERLFDKD